MQHIGRVDVLESSQDLVEEVANMIIAQVLSFEQFVKVGLHQSLHNVAGLESGKIQYFLPSPSLYALLYDIEFKDTRLSFLLRMSASKCLRYQ